MNRVLQLTCAVLAAGCLAGPAGAGPDPHADALARQRAELPAQIGGAPRVEIDRRTGKRITHGPLLTAEQAAAYQAGPLAAARPAAKGSERGARKAGTRPESTLGVGGIATRIRHQDVDLGGPDEHDHSHDNASTGAR